MNGKAGDGPPPPPPICFPLWRNTLQPVYTMAMLCSLAASMDSWSLMLPPGWIMAVIPAYAAVSTASLNGKKASEAMTHPSVGSSALKEAIFAESTRLI